MTRPQPILPILEAVRAHLTEWGLTEVASLTIHPERTVDLQLSGYTREDTLAAALLVWAPTLTDAAATTWRPPHGDTVHLTLTGLIPGGPPIEVWGAVSVTEVGAVGADLDLGESRALTLGELRTLAGGVAGG